MSAIYLYICLDARVVPALLGATAVSPKAFLVGPNVGFIRGIAQSCEYQVVSPQCGPVRANPPVFHGGKGHLSTTCPKGACACAFGLCSRSLDRSAHRRKTIRRAGHVPIDDPVPGSPRVALGKAWPRTAGCFAWPPFRAAGPDGTALPRAASRLATEGRLHMISSHRQYVHWGMPVALGPSKGPGWEGETPDIPGPIRYPSLRS